MNLALAYHGLIDSHLTLFGTGVDYYVLKFICERTLRFNKVSEIIPAKHFVSGIPGVVLGVPYARENITKAKRRLRKNKIIFYEPRCDGHCEITINLPGIWYVIKKLYGDISIINEKVVRSIETAIGGFGNFVKPTLNRRGVQLVKKYKEIYDEEIKASKPRRMSRHESELKISYMRSYFADKCDEYEVGYSREPMTQKLKTQIKRFVYNDCEQMGEDPKKLIDEVISKWNSIHKNLKTDFNKPMTVPANFTFSFFYAHRVRIINYIRTEATQKHHFAKVHIIKCED